MRYKEQALKMLVVWFCFFITKSCSKTMPSWHHFACTCFSVGREVKVTSRGHGFATMFNNRKSKSSYFACTIVLYKELFYKVRDIRNKFKKRLYQTSYLLRTRNSFGMMKKSFSPDSVSVQNLILTFLGHSVLNSSILMLFYYLAPLKNDCLVTFGDSG